MEPIVASLDRLIRQHAWQAPFQDALASAAAQGVRSLSPLRSIEDYLGWLDALVKWAPRESGDSRMVQDKLVEFYFYLDQPSLLALQSPIRPGVQIELTPLSQWIKDFAVDWGLYLDTLESAQHVDSFRSNPMFHWDDYMPPASGYLTFNQFFSRHVKPGRRPVAALQDPSVIVSPADAIFIGKWRVSGRSTIYVADSKVDIKGIEWSIRQLLDESRYAERFDGGMFTHCALRTFDYHRVHAPVSGRVLEARVVQGQAYLEVTAEPGVVGGEPQPVLCAREGTGYQFLQTRGLIVLDSPIGLVACLPVGMAQVASVVLTAEEGVSLRKGEELGYFQFGGSDFVTVFERQANVEFTCRPGEHYLQGAAIARAHPQH